MGQGGNSHLEKGKARLVNNKIGGEQNYLDGRRGELVAILLSDSLTKWGEGKISREELGGGLEPFWKGKKRFHHLRRGTIIAEDLGRTGSLSESTWCSKLKKYIATVQKSHTINRVRTVKKREAKKNIPYKKAEHDILLKGGRSCHTNLRKSSRNNSLIPGEPHEEDLTNPERHCEMGQRLREKKRSFIPSNGAQESPTGGGGEELPLLFGKSYFLLPKDFHCHSEEKQQPAVGGGAALPIENVNFYQSIHGKTPLGLNFSKHRRSSKKDLDVHHHLPKKIKSLSGEKLLQKACSRQHFLERKKFRVGGGKKPFFHLPPLLREGRGSPAGQSRGRREKSPPGKNSGVWLTI